MNQKVCISCKTTKNLSEFHKNRRSNDGCCVICKRCACDRASGWFKKNPERAKEVRSAYYIANHSALREGQRVYRINNLAKCSAISKRWREENKDRKRELDRKWQAAHPEKVRRFRRVSQHRRRIAEASSQGQHTASDVQNLLSLQREKCVCCKASLKLGYQIDHIQPLSRGGHNGRSNIQLLCPSCNKKKSAKDPIRFMQENGFLL